MNWYYESAGQQQGPVTEIDLDRLLSEGKITLDSLVWREGMSGWTPLRVARPPGAPAPAIPQNLSLEPSVPAAGAAPSATAGSDSPQPGWIRCSFTGRYFPPSEIIYLEGKPYSAAAKPQVVAAMQGGTMPTTTSFGDERIGPAWEQRQQLGFFKAIVDTVKAVLTLPVQCFSTMKRQGGIGSPFLYWLVTAGIGVEVAQVYNLLMQSVMIGAGAASQASSQAAAILGMQAAMGASMLFIAPVFLIIWLFAFTGLVHLCLMMLKGANQSYETTFRTMAYAFGSTGLFNILPICGAYIAPIWGIVATCIGLGPAHGTSTGKGVGATLLAFLFCCIGIGVVSIGIVAAFGSAFSAASGSRSF
jgi:hypothetical protein